MIKYLFALVMLVHGLIHFMGFSKAFGYGNMSQLSRDISKPLGFVWLLSAFLFIGATAFLLLKKESWQILSMVAVILSQILIITFWKDAKFGTIVNIIILITAIASWGIQNFESRFKKDVKAHLQRTNSLQTNLLVEADLHHLPAPVQKYLRYAGVLNQPKVTNVKIVFDGEMRDKGKDWFKFQSLQYNFFDNPARLFFMKATMFGMTVPGYHDYQQSTARMRVKIFGLFPVLKAEGDEMNKAETVTVFNDMCLMVPAALIDKRIKWETVDSLSAKATFRNGPNMISATLYFNEAGQLINFISDDRYAISDMNQYRFSTPVKAYKEMDGRNVPTYGEAIWHYPEGQFVYGKFYLKSIEYNVSK